MSYTVLVVDDEPLTRDFLASAIPRGFPVFGRVLQARNGCEALDVLKNTPCDLLITDIRMPLMDGLALSRHAQELYPAMPVVILSGYNEFAYAQEAMQYGVRGYLLKPIDNAKLAEMLGMMQTLLDEQRNDSYDRQHMRAVVDEYRMSLGGEYLEALYEQNPARRLAVAPLVKQLDIRLFEGKQAVLSFALGAESVLARAESVQDMDTQDYLLYRLLCEMAGECDAESAVYFGGSGHHILLRAPDDTTIEAFYAQVAQVLQSGAGLGLLCGASLAFAGEEAFHTAVRGADETLMHGLSGGAGFYTGQAARTSRTDALETSRIRVISALSAQDTPTVLLAVANYLNEAKLQEIPAPAAGLWLLYPRPPALEMDGADYCAILQKVIALLKQEPGWTNLASLLAQALMPPAPAANEGGRERRVVEQAQKFIQSHYQEPISLIDIAEHIDVSPNYLSGLFSRQTGESYIKHLTKVRMEAAARLLLAEKNKKMADVATACGFYNVKHFFRVFRLTYGMSPGEYKTTCPPPR